MSSCSACPECDYICSDFCPLIGEGIQSFNAKQEEDPVAEAVKSLQPVIAKAKANPWAIKCWDYCGSHYHYYCQCDFMSPVEILDPAKPCPACGTQHTEYQEAGL